MRFDQLEPQREDATRRLRRKPQLLIVKDFSFPRQAAVRADRSGEELVAFEQKLQISLRGQLVRALGRYGIPVTVATTSQELRKLRKRQPAWLITGSLLASIRVAAPCASLWDWERVGRKWKQPRKFMTFLRSRQQPLFTFSTTGGSNAEPGLITSVGPLAPTTVPVLVISMAGKGMHGVSEDVLFKWTAPGVSCLLFTKYCQMGRILAARSSSSS